MNSVEKRIQNRNRLFTLVYCSHNNCPGIVFLKKLYSCFDFEVN